MTAKPVGKPTVLQKKSYSSLDTLATTPTSEKLMTRSSQERIKTQSILSEIQKLSNEIGSLVTDGELHRFGEGKEFWYVARHYPAREGHLVLYATIGNWQTGEKVQFYETKKDSGNYGKQFNFKKQIKVATNKAIDHKAVASVAKKEWDGLAETGSSVYLERKKIVAPQGIRYSKSFIAVPTITLTGEWLGFQKIFYNGNKFFFKKQQLEYACFIISGDASETVLCEGFATGCSINMATGKTVVVCFHSSNLEKVASALVESPEYLMNNYLIAADNDIATKGNPGLTYGKRAATLLGCKMVYPDFVNPNGKKTTDFNDLHCIEGIEKVLEQMENPYV